MHIYVYRERDSREELREEGSSASIKTKQQEIDRGRHRSKAKEEAALIKLNEAS
jgi:hypothetical protein